MGRMPKILLVDDEERLRGSLKKMLVMNGYEVSTAGNGTEGLKRLLAEPFDLAIVDLIMPETDGMWLLDKINRENIGVGTIVATGYGTVESAVMAMKLGAWDFIQKPVDFDLMKILIARALEKGALIREKSENEKKIKWQNEELLKANRQLKELDKLKTSFLSKAVHELRSPLTVISCSLEILREDLGPGGGDELLKLVDNSIKFTTIMAALVDDMLDINMIISGKIRMAMKKGDLGPLLAEVVDGFLPLAKKNGIKVEVSIPDNLEEVLFSKERVGQVIINLLSNATKFTPESGSINIRAEDGGDELVVSVVDSGCGIPADDLDHVFDEFFQSDNGKKGGSGLGLAICKRIIGEHGGRVWVESREGKGSAFHFAIPKCESY